MATTLPDRQRIVTLDLVRGVAVMGILAMNIIAFSMPFAAYMNPLAYGLEDRLDMLAWLVGFVAVDGKMRGLFSLLFGASMLLVIERSEAAGESAAEVHFRRMIWLLLIGLVHLYFVWFGDILTLYALVGMIAWPLRRWSPAALVRLGIALLAVQLLIFAVLAALAVSLEGVVSAPGAPAEALRHWQTLQGKFGIPPASAIADDLALFRGSYAAIVEARLDRHAAAPLVGLVMFGWETLAYFLFGMAALKSGMLAGDWPDHRYRAWALAGLAVGIPAYALLAWLVVNAGFSVPAVMALVMAATVPFRPPMILAYAALVILLTRRGGWLARRIAAAGRAAFSNYLGTSLAMTGLFYGYGAGLYGRLDRAELWLVVAAMWLVMLAWSKPWLDRFHYGPMEWAWRSLARGSLQPMVRRTA